MSGCKTQASAPAVMATPYKKDFSGPIIVDPVTRIEGHLGVVVEVTGGKISNVWSQSQLFRGIETILKGRDPRDAQHFTQRSCGVCTYVHALASIRAVDNAAGVKIPALGQLQRNLCLVSQYMHDHVVHFYHLHALDWVDVTSALAADPKKAASIANSISPRPTKAGDLKAVQDKLKSFVEAGQLGPFTNAYFLGGHDAYYLPPEVNLIATAHYLEALKLQVKAARAMAILGAKNPHTQFTILGGTSNYDALKPERIEEYKALYMETKAFIDEVYIPDLLAVASYYKDWGGIGGTRNFLSFGEFKTDEFDMDSGIYPQGAIFERDINNVKGFNPDELMEHVAHSWYEGTEALHPYKGVTEPKYTDIDDKERYSWMKAPRYMGEAMEVGPLAHTLIAYAKGEPLNQKYVNLVLEHLGVGPEALFSTLGRTAARGIECAVTAQHGLSMLEEYTERALRGEDICIDTPVPDKAQGVGYCNAPRGGLSHWINIEGGKIANYQYVVPSTWNIGPRCGNDKLGPLEEALMGTPIADPERPVEILRTIHSYDPCIACGVHVIHPETNKVHTVQA